MDLNFSCIFLLHGPWPLAGSHAMDAMGGCPCVATGWCAAAATNWWWGQFLFDGTSDGGTLSEHSMSSKRFLVYKFAHPSGTDMSPSWNQVMICWLSLSSFIFEVFYDGCGPDPTEFERWFLTYTGDSQVLSSKMMSPEDALVNKSTSSS